jgi:hypothetical protein
MLLPIIGVVQLKKLYELYGLFDFELVSQIELIRAIKPNRVVRELELIRVRA